MNLVVSGKHVEVPEAVQEYTQRKLGKLSRYLQNIVEAKVEFSRANSRSQGEHHIVQVTLATKNTILRGEERSPNVYTAIDAVAAVMERQIERYKGKHYVKRKVDGENPGSPGSEEASADILETGKVVKVKRFPIKPMTLEEAMEQMELLGHTFFVFIPAGQSQLQVLYKRRDGDYGVIEPELL